MFAQDVFEGILKLAQPQGRTDQNAVVEFRTEVHGLGEPCRLLCSGDGRFLALARRRTVALSSQGHDDEGITVSWQELEALLPLLNYWRKHLEQWPSFDSGGAVAFGAAFRWHYYTPPGEAPKRALPERFDGKTMRRWLGKPRRPVPGVKIVAERWHVGETVVDVPAKGVLIGEIYAIADDLYFESGRHGGVLSRGSDRRRWERPPVLIGGDLVPSEEGWVELEPGDLGFLERLLSWKQEKG